MDISWNTLTYTSKKLKILPQDNCKEIHTHSHKMMRAKEKKEHLVGCKREVTHYTQVTPTRVTANFSYTKRKIKKKGRKKNTTLNT